MTLLYRKTNISPYKKTKVINGTSYNLDVQPDLCRCISGKDIPNGYADHTDEIWDYYKYQSRTENGIECPSIMPDDENQQCAVQPIEKNSTCWIYDMFSGGNTPNFSNTMATNRSYGATYFTIGWNWPVQSINSRFECDYGETCLESADDDSNPDYIPLIYEFFEECKTLLNIETGTEPYMEIARRHIGRRINSQSQGSFISPKHVTLCQHCIGGANPGNPQCPDFDNCYQYVSQITDNGRQDFQVKILNPFTDERLEALYKRDMYVAEIVDPSRSFSSHYTHYVSPITIKSYVDQIPNGSLLLKDSFLKFTVNGQGHFHISEIILNDIRASYSGQFVPNSFSARNLTDLFQTITKLRIDELNNIPQPKITFKQGSSSTCFNLYTKDNITLWPVGHAWGQYIHNSWRSSIVGNDPLPDEFSIDIINDILIEKGQSPLIEYTNIDNIYKLSDFIPFDQIPGGDEVFSVGDSIVIATQDSPLQKLPSTSFPYGSRKENNLEKNYTYLGFKPGILLQAAELNELQDNSVIQNSLNVEYAFKWPILGKQYQSNNTIDEQTKTLLTGMPDENYIFPIPNSNYCFPYSPSLVSVNLTSPSILYVVLKDGWYNIPLNNINYWYYIENPVSVNLTVTNEINKTLYLDVQQIIVNSSFIPTDEGYEFNDKSNRFINPITDGADRVKLLATFTEFPENTAIPILKVRRGDSSVGSNRILVQTMNNCKISDINI